MTEEQGKTDSKSRELWARAVAAIVMIVGIILVIFLPRVAPTTDTATIVVLLLVPLLVYGVGSGRVREFTGPLGLGAKLTEVKNELEETKEEVRAIQTQIALQGILSKFEMGHLRGLNRDTKYEIQWEPDLYKYLHRLDGLNFIQPHPGLGLMTIEEKYKTDDPPERRPRFNLKDFVYITKDGERYLETLDQILEKTKKQRREGSRFGAGS